MEKECHLEFQRRQIFKYTAICIWPNINSDVSHRLLEDSEKRDKNWQEIEKERLRDKKKRVWRLVH
jgi:hypothetical protein